MKQKTKYLSKATMSIVLALVLVVSTLAVGIVATNAAYVNGKPGAEANAADVAGDKTADVEDAAVGAKAPEAVGAQAGDSVGSNDALGTPGYSIYFKSKNGTSYDVEYFNAYNVNITVNVADLKLDDTSKLKFKVKSYKSGESDVWWGNDNVVNSPGSNTTLANNNENGGYFKNANNYTRITLKLAKDGNDLKMYWVSGVSTAHNVTYNTPKNGSLPSNTTANTGDWVQFAATPNPGYQVSTVTYTPSGGSATNCTQVSGNTYKFQMPDKDVAVSATFSKRNYTINKTETNCTVAVNGTAQYQDEVSFTVSPTSGYALQTLTVKQGATNVPYTDNLNGTYTFNMPAGAVAITAICANTSGSTTVYFKSATAYVYHPLISVNGGTEQKMEIAKDGNNQPIYLEKGSKDSKVKPKSDTGSLRYAWYKIELTDVDLSSPVSIVIRGQDTYMEATGTFALTEGGSIYLACDNLMEGNTLVNLTSASDAVKDFYDTPLHMVATAAEIAAINGN